MHTQKTLIFPVCFETYRIPTGLGLILKNDDDDDEEEDDVMSFYLSNLNAVQECSGLDSVMYKWTL